VWNHLQEVVFDSSKYLHEDSPLGVLLGGFFGYTDHPTQGEGGAGGGRRARAPAATTIKNAPVQRKNFARFRRIPP